MDIMTEQEEPFVMIRSWFIVITLEMISYLGVYICW
jgi:hypothetical protein